MLYDAGGCLPMIVSVNSNWSSTSTLTLALNIQHALADLSFQRLLNHCRSRIGADPLNRADLMKSLGDEMDPWSSR